MHLIRHPIQDVIFAKAAVLILMLMALSGIPASLFAAGPMSDAEKRELALNMYAEYQKKFPEVEDIAPDSAIKLLSDPDVVFVDVRKAEEQAVSMIPGAITKQVFTDHLERYRHKRVIAYCTISYRSGMLAAELKRKGISVINLRAGLLGWTHAGGPLVRQNRPVQRLHVFGRKWDLAPAAVDTVYFKWYQKLFAR
ncbi:MAG: rhodanese-like domain-containing protein [Desulfobacteraceae bacterium]|jgi:sodium/bile acid cotransporter 7